MHNQTVRDAVSGMPRLPKGDVSREQGCMSHAGSLQAMLRARRSSAAPTRSGGR